MKALLLIDLQNDFLPTGALPVADGDAVLPVANRLQPLFELVVATQDWHPPDHCSFAASHPGYRVGDEVTLPDGTAQRLWPVHCVQGSAGAELPPILDTARIARIFRKASEPGVESYSEFFDHRGRRSTELDAFLRRRGVDELYVMGLALDVCVRSTALDAARLGYRTHVIVDGTRPVDAAGGRKTLDEMRRAGIELVTSGEVVAALSGRVGAAP